MEASLLSASVTGMLKILGNKLAPLVTKEYNSIVGVKKDLKELKDLAEQINCWLDGREEAMGGARSFNWLRKLKDVTYDVDDVVDEFQMETEKLDTDDDSSTVSQCLCKKPKSFLLQCKVAHKIKAIKKRFAIIVDEAKNQNDIAAVLGHPVHHSNKATVIMPTLAIVNEAAIFGRNQDKNKIITKLVKNHGQKEIEIVSIIGLGGTGKTTLAKLVLNDDDKIREHFEARLWVHVSQEFNVTKIIENLFEEVTKKKSDHHTLLDMSDIISEKLSKKRVLLVLDDIWIDDRSQHHQFQENILVHLKSSASGSKILLTTRSKRVAEVMESTELYDLPFLSLEDSWQLFNRSLGEGVKKLGDEYQQVGQEIVGKCGGIPLAIKVLACTLRDKELIGEWKAIRDNSLLSVEGEESVSACLKLSYFYLPSHLKQCFTLCSLFPKGYLIYKQQLIDLWIAHGMVSLTLGVDDLEHIGHRYFNSLVEVSFLEVEDKYKWGVRCKMHDLIHDLARSIFCEEISTIVPEDATSSTKGYRFFSLTEPRKLLPKKVFGNARAIYVDKGNDILFGSSLKNAKRLRSIIIENFVLSTTVLTTIFEVKNLKYLDISETQCEALPEAITDLWCLQALYLKSSKLLKLPESIGMLKKLRTLNLSRCSNLKSLPDSIGDCQMLSTLDLNYCNAFEDLPNSIGWNKRLRVLRLVSTVIRSLPSSITTLENLEYLTIKQCFELVGLPEDIGKLTKLKELDVDISNGLPAGIGKLTQLEKLSTFCVQTDKTYAQLSELATLSRISGRLSIYYLRRLTDQCEAHQACLKQKEKLHELHLSWSSGNNKRCEEHEVVALDGLEPPLGIKRLYIYSYGGERFASWMLKQASGGVQGHGQFPFLTKMSLEGELSVNCRGCGQPEAVQELRHLVAEKRPAVVFLMETRMGEERALGLKRDLGFPNAIVVKSEGLSGGLVLLWRHDVTVFEMSKSRSHIDVTLSCEQLNISQWRLTGFYGEPRRERRRESWYLMRFLRAQSADPWLCVGDFNEVLKAEEQIGGNERENWQMANFREAVYDCNLTDLGFHGLPYTWDNRQAEGNNVKARLDRAFGDEKFLERLGETEVFHIPLAESDHNGLLVEVRQRMAPVRRGRRRSKPFRYENMWPDHGEYNTFVNQAWDPGPGVCDLARMSDALVSMQGALKKWDREVFGSVKKQIRELRLLLEEERGGTLYRGPTDREKEIMAKLNTVLAREETMEKQRSRIAWLREGDRNTAFFQAKARARNRANRIRMLQDESGRVFTEQEDLERLACDFYQNLFSAQELLQPELVTRFVPRKVTPEMADNLNRPFTAQEIETALFQMKPCKSPGVDGFNAGFYQAHWSLLGHCVVEAALSFLNGGVLPDEVNRTLLVLIPKVSNPQELAQYRPISLCNVLYKICSKAMANRMRSILDEVISGEQSAFVPGRLITDNVLIAYECTHYLRHKKGRTGGCAIKLDMAKAYDRVEWGYLEAIMQALGFPPAWISLVMKCVTTVSFSVRVNGVFSDSFKPSRGIRQGDPISPYLFLLCSEGLSNMLRNVGPQFISRGVRVSVHAPWISHLLFADDCIIFTEASKRGADRVASILEDYNKGSGQLVNKHKSAIFFSPNTEEDCKTEVQESLQIFTEALGERYLGLPTAAERGAADAFNYVLGRVIGMINGWAEKSLSCAAREVLLKSNAQSVPTYAMSVFKLSPVVCRKLTTAVSNYWWGSQIDSHKIHWLRWEKMTRGKEDGGLGFRDFTLFNQAMLGKQGWRLLSRPDSLCARVLKGKYFPHTNFLSATKKKRSSATWRAILHGREVLRKGLIKRVGPGDINVWEENWIPGLRSLRPLVKLPTATVQHVSDLFLQGTRIWDERKVHESFMVMEAEEVLKVKPSLRLEEDVLAWAYEKSGLYSVRSAYQLLKRDQMAHAMQVTNEQSSSDSMKTWQVLWKLKVPPKVRVFWWRAMHNALPSKSELKRRHVAKESYCEFCGNPDESLHHIFFTCPVARRFWQEAKHLTGIEALQLHPASWMTDVLKPSIVPVKTATLMISGAWALWTGRNARRNGRKTWEPGAMARYISKLLEDLCSLKGNGVPERQGVFQQWRPPEENWVKINTDAGFSTDTCAGRTGVVIRDHSGTVLAAAARAFDDIPDVLTAEALGVKEGLELAAELGFDRVVLESDCQGLVNLLNSPDASRSTIGGICVDIAEIARSFMECRVVWISRKANSVAHVCASSVSEAERCIFWVESVPDWLQLLAAEDCNHTVNE